MSIERPSLDRATVENDSLPPATAADQPAQCRGLCSPWAGFVGRDLLDGEIHLDVAGTEVGAGAFGRVDHEAVEMLTRRPHCRNRWPGEGPTGPPATPIAMSTPGRLPEPLGAHVRMVRRGATKRFTLLT